MAYRAEVMDHLNMRCPLLAFKGIWATLMTDDAEMTTKFVAWMDFVAHICAKAQHWSSPSLSCNEVGSGEIEGKTERQMLRAEPAGLPEQQEKGPKLMLGKKLPAVTRIMEPEEKQTTEGKYWY
jgi:hypothetical protein